MLGYLAGITATIFWGFDTVVIRWLIQQGIDPFLIGALRLYIGSTMIILVTAALRIKKGHISTRIAYTKFFWLTTVGLAANFLLFHKGLEFTIASDAVLLEAFSPVMVLIIVMLFIPNRVKHLLQHPHLPQRILQIIILGSIGSSLLLINDPKDILMTTQSKFIGDIIEFIAMFAWALVLLGMHEYQKREDQHNILAATAQFLFLAAVLISPFVPWGEISFLSPTQWGWILILGVFSTGFSYVLWHFASKLIDIFPLMTIFNLVSVFTVLTESLALGLNITWKLFVGGILILYAAMHAKLINTKYKILEK